MRLTPRGCDPLHPETLDCDLTSTLYGKGRITNLIADRSNRVIYATTTARLIGILDDLTHSWSVRFIPETELIESIDQIAVTGGNEPLLYVSVRGRGGANLFQSRDGGENWDLIKASQLPRAGFRRLVPDPTSVDRLYIASPTGAIRTINGGQDWSARKLDFPPTLADEIHVTGGDNASLYVTIAGAGNIYRSDNPARAESSWIPADSGLDAVAVRDLMSDPRNPDVLYAGVFSPRQWSVFVTRNRGQDWKLLGSPPEEFRDDDTMSLALAVLDDQHSILYAGTNGSGILRADLGSEYGQVTWQHCPANVNNVSKVLVPPWNPRVAYALADGRTLISTADGGLSWITVGVITGTAPISSLEIGGIPDVLYIATKGDGVLRSTDGGKTWHNISTKLPDRIVVSLAVDGAHDDMLYVVTEAGVVYRSADAGGHWEDIREKLNATAPRKLILYKSKESPVPRLILSSNDGVYYYTRNKFLGFELP